MRSDTELVGAAATGDAQAFGEIVTRYQSLVCAIAYSGTGDHALSEELAQDTFVAAWKGLRELRDTAKLKAWLAGIARNLVKGAHRSRARSRTEPLAAAPDPVATTPSPLQGVLDDEEQAIVWRALEQIPETYREPLVLFYREEQSVDRVAEALDLSGDAVKQRLSRGRQMLREQVAELVEGALARTRPGTAFTVAVLAVLPAAAPQAAAAAVAAGAAEGSLAAKGAAATGLAGAVAGPLLGLAGGYIGAKVSIENTRSPRERRFMVRMAWQAFAFALVFTAVELLGLLFLPRVFANLPVQLLVAGVYTTLLVVFILRSNRRQRQIQMEDGTYVDPRAIPQTDLAESPKGAVYGSLAGAILGPLCWIPIMAGIASDWALAAATVAFALMVYTAAVAVALRSPRAFFRVEIAATAAVGAWTATLVNWKWETWMTAYRHTSVYEPLSDLPLWAMNVLLAAIYLWVTLRFVQLDRQGRTAFRRPGKT